MLSIAFALALAAAAQTVPPASGAPQPVPPASGPPRPGPWIQSPPAEAARPLTGIGAPSPDAPVVATPLPRPMMLEVERDAITDDLRAFAVARTSGARLEVGCDHRRRSGVIVRFTGRFWLAPGNRVTGERPLRHRFDLTEPVRAYWRMRDRTATMWERDDIAPFIAWMRVSQRVVIRAIDVEKREVDLEFPLIGAAETIDHVLALCGDARLAAEMARAD